MGRDKTGHKKASSGTPAAINLGQAINRARRREFLSQAYVARALGVNNSFVVGTEKGTRVPDLIELLRIAKVLNLDETKLMSKVVDDLKEG